MLRRLWNRLRSHSFRAKLIISSVACILIPALFTLALSNYLTKDAVREQATANAAKTLQLVNGSVQGLFNFMLYVANSIQVDPEISYILKDRAAGKEYASPDAEYEKFANDNTIIKMLDYLSRAQEQSMITIILPNGQYFTNYSFEEFHPSQWRQEPWFAELDRLNGYDTYWVGVQPTRFRSYRPLHDYELSVARTLRNTSSKIYAYVVVTIFEDQVHPLFGELSPGHEMMLLDRNGVILSHQDADRIGQTFEYAGQTSSIVHHGGSDYLLAEEKLTGSGWKLISLTPYQDAVSKISTIYNNVFLIEILAFIAFLLILIYLIRKFTSPLKRLGKVAETVYRGNLEVRSRMSGPDEIGMLGMSIDQMLDRLKQMLEEVTVEQTQKRRAELAMLQAQIRPHFLFNVLNSIRMRIMLGGDAESGDMISSLSKLLRMTIEAGDGDITLAEEIQTSADYVKLMNMRQKEKVELLVDIPGDALGTRVPRLFLQPIIENAIIHGISQRGGVIRISCRQQEHAWLLSVRDYGCGMEAPALEKLRSRLRETRSLPDAAESGSGFSSIGLANVNERMRMTFGDRFEMEIDSEPGAGTSIRMHIPIGEANGDESHVG